MDSEGDDEAAVGEPAHQCRPEADRGARQAPRESDVPGRAAGAEVIQHEGAGHRREGVDRADGKIDASGDDDERHAHRHDRDEARVLGELREVLRVQELVPLHERRRALTVGVGDEHPLAGPVRPLLEERRADRPTEGGQKGAEHEDDDEETAFLEAQQTAKRQAHEAWGGGRWTEGRRGRGRGATACGGGARAEWRAQRRKPRTRS